MTRFWSRSTSEGSLMHACVRMCLSLSSCVCVCVCVCVYVYCVWQFWSQSLVCTCSFSSSKKKTKKNSIHFKSITIILDGHALIVPLPICHMKWCIHFAPNCSCFGKYCAFHMSHNILTWLLALRMQMQEINWNCVGRLFGFANLFNAASISPVFVCRNRICCVQSICHFDGCRLWIGPKTCSSLNAILCLKMQSHGTEQNLEIYHFCFLFFGLTWMSAIWTISQFTGFNYDNVTYLHTICFFNLRTICSFFKNFVNFWCVTFQMHKIVYFTFDNERYRVDVWCYISFMWVLI